MVRVFAFTSLALVAVSAVSGLVIPRQIPPKGWQTKLLEVGLPFGELDSFSRAFCSPMDSITNDTWLSIARQSMVRLSSNSVATRSW